MINKPKLKPSLLSASIPILFTGGILFISAFKYDIGPHIPLFLGSLVAGITAYSLGYTWEDIENALVKNISQAISALIILLIIGMLIAVWIGSGIVPGLIYYGFKIIIPSWFLPSVFLLCIIVSLISGSAWTTIGTIGVAATAIGQGMGISLAPIAGAIVSGAFFGDKISPLSDSTNLTPSVLGVDLYEHIKHMLHTTVPSLIISLMVYVALGMFLRTGDHIAGESLELQKVIGDYFNLSPWLIIPPLVVIIMIAKKTPPIPSLSIGVILGAITQLIVQNQSLGKVFSTMYSGYEISTSSEEVNTLLSRGGLQSMYSVVILGIISLAFGGIMYECGLLRIIVDRMKKLINKKGHLITVTLLTSLGINIIGANQYLAVILPGQMYKDLYKALNMKLKNLTRALEGGGTLTAPLIPWNTSGLFIISVLGIGPLEYGLYAIFCWVTPLIVSIFAYRNITIEYIK